MKVSVFIGTLTVFCFMNMSHANGIEQNTIEDDEYVNEFYVDENYIEDILEEQKLVLEFNEIQQIIDQSIPENTYDISVFFTDVLNENIDMDFKEIIQNLVLYSMIDLKKESVYVFKILLIIIFSAVYNNLATSFNNKQVLNISNLVIVMALTSILLSSYNVASEIASDVVNKFDVFINALIPSMMAVSVMSGSMISGNIFTQCILMISGLINNIIKNGFIPFLYLILVFIIINTISDNNGFKKMIELLKKTYYFGLKTMIVIFLGVYSIQSIGLPSVDSLVTKTTKQTVSAVPVVGSTLSEVAEIVMSCGNMTKNVFGLGVMIGGLLIVIYPIVKLLIISFVYKGLAALVEPIVEKKIVNCISDVGDICFMLFSTITFVLSLFLISVTLSMYISNVKNYLM